MMPSNSSSLTTEVKWEIFRHAIYIIEGLAIFISNVLIVLTIGRHQALRYLKEYISLAALALADGLGASGTVFAGFYRITIWLLHKDQDPASGRFCILMGHNLVWLNVVTASHFMLSVVSLDRLLSVAFPLKHMTLTRSYMFKLIALAYGGAFAIGAYIFSLNWVRVAPVHTMICWSSHGYGMDGSSIRDSAVTLGTLTSIVLYLGIPVVHAYRKNRVASVSNRENARNNSFQKQLNKAVATSCVFTFLCVGLPWLVVTVSSNLAVDVYEIIAVWMFIVANVNPICNFFIYYSKQKLFRMGFKALIQNKTMPASIDNWKETRKSRGHNETKI